LTQAFHKTKVPGFKVLIVKKNWKVENNIKDKVVVSTGAMGQAIKTAVLNKNQTANER
jgi:hypothetical protein